MKGKPPGSIIGLWRIKGIFVIMFQMVVGDFLASAYNDKDLRLFDSKILPSQLSFPGVSHLVSDHNLPWCFLGDSRNSALLDGDNFLCRFLVGQDTLSFAYFSFTS